MMNHQVESRRTLKEVRRSQENNQQLRIERGAIAFQYRKFQSDHIPSKEKESAESNVGRKRFLVKNGCLIGESSPGGRGSHASKHLHGQVRGGKDNSRGKNEGSFVEPSL